MLTLETDANLALIKFVGPLPPPAGNTLGSMVSPLWMTVRRPVLERMTGFTDAMMHIYREHKMKGNDLSIVALHL